MTGCKWSCYGVPCKESAQSDYPYCRKHDARIKEGKFLGACWKCGKQSVRGCDMELQFVCGAPCCSSHPHEDTHFK